MRFYILCNRKWLGIVETNYAFAACYWAQRSRATGKRFTLTTVAP